MEDSQKVTVLKPSAGWAGIDFAGIWQYRDLLLLLVRRDFLAQYKQTILGPAWFVLQPLFLTIVFTLIFGNFAQIPTEGLPPLLFYNSGLIIWSYFSSCFTGNASVFTSNAGIYQKVYYPRLINPLANCTSALFGFSIQIVFFLGYFCIYKFLIPTEEFFSMTWAMLLLPALIPLVASLGLGMGLWMSVLTAKYRDFNQITGFLAQALMYATPIIYPLSEIPERYRFWASLNPMAPVVETFRFALLGKGSFSTPHLIYSGIVALCILLSGMYFFKRTERRVVDYL
ncbi:MAG: ABC transporter permease [Puniceicoccaceae bacterium]|nr:ABC transporter permease [Puniceicoccaceae bacterium]